LQPFFIDDYPSFHRRLNLFSFISRPSNDLESPMKGSSPARAWPAGHMSDIEGGASPSGSPSSSPKNNKRNPKSHPPPSTDDESEGEMKKPTRKSNIRNSFNLQPGNYLKQPNARRVSISNGTQ
jgi:hypothetical protein